MIPIAAFLIFQAMARLPMQEVEVKQVASADSAAMERARRDADMGLDRPLTGFLRPWTKLLVEGRPLGFLMKEDRASLQRRLFGSLRCGAMALAFALLAGGLLALVRLESAGRRVEDALEAVPVFVFGTPVFILAYLVVIGAGVSVIGSEVLAAAILAVAPAVFLGTVLHGALRTEMLRPYVLAAQARGRTRRSAMLRHALPNALPSLLDALPPVATTLIVGSFVVEKAVRVHNFGELYVQAAEAREVELVVVCTTLFVAILVIVSTVTELVRVVVDPRARA